MSPDFFNGLFEFGGSILLWQNVARLYKDKLFRGVSIVPTTFFFLWGLWNTFYYPYLHQWWSFSGGLSIVIANGTWVGLMFLYRKN